MIDQGHRYSKQLIGLYPKEIVTLYWHEVNFYVACGKRKNYAVAVGILNEIRSVMLTHGEGEKWQREYHAFCEKHRRKKLLMEALKESGK